MRLIYRCISLFCLLTLAFSVQAKPLQVLSSIKPLALIVKAVAGEQVNQQTLLSANLTPHHYALKVSDLKKIQQADLIVWVGPSLETFLAKPLAKKPQQLQWLASKGHSHIEPHPWLSISQSLLFAAQIKQRLSLLKPELEPVFAANLQRLQLQLLGIDARLSLSFSQQTAKFVVMHNAYQELVEAYGLQQLGVILPSAGKKPGVKHIKQLQDLVAQGDLQCLVAEYGQSDKWLRLIDKQQRLAWLFLDPLASQAKIDTYPELIAGLGEALSGC